MFYRSSSAYILAPARVSSLRVDDSSNRRAVAAVIRRSHTTCRKLQMRAQVPVLRHLQSARRCREKIHRMPHCHIENRQCLISAGVGLNPRCARHAQADTATRISA
jgi:hypothetical protein